MNVEYLVYSRVSGYTALVQIMQETPYFTHTGKLFSERNEKLSPRHC